MKRYAAFLIAMLLLSSATACGNNQPVESSVPSEPPAESAEVPVESVSSGSNKSSVDSVSAENTEVSSESSQTESVKEEEPSVAAFNSFLKGEITAIDHIYALNDELGKPQYVTEPYTVSPDDHFKYAFADINNDGVKEMLTYGLNGDITLKSYFYNDGIISNVLNHSFFEFILLDDCEFYENGIYGLVDYNKNDQYGKFNTDSSIYITTTFHGEKPLESSFIEFPDGTYELRPVVKGQNGKLMIGIGKEKIEKADFEAAVDSAKAALGKKLKLDWQTL